MSEKRNIAGKELLRLFTKHGWSLKRVKGSHHILKHPDGRTAVIPIHDNKPLHAGLLHDLLQKLESDS